MEYLILLSIFIVENIMNTTAQKIGGILSSRNGQQEIWFFNLFK